MIHQHMRQGLVALHIGVILRRGIYHFQFKRKQAQNVTCTASKGPYYTTERKVQKILEQKWETQLLKVPSTASTAEPCN